MGKTVLAQVVVFSPNRFGGDITNGIGSALSTVVLVSWFEGFVVLGLGYWL